MVPRSDEIGYLFDKVRSEIAPGLLVFLGTECQELVIVPGSDQFDIISFARTHSVRYGLPSESIVDRIRYYDRQFGVDIVWADTNSVRVNFRDLPVDIDSFLDDAMAFSPDRFLLGRKDSVKGALQKWKHFHFWWDDTFNGKRKLPPPEGHDYRDILKRGRNKYTPDSREAVGALLDKLKFEVVRQFSAFDSGRGVDDRCFSVPFRGNIGSKYLRRILDVLPEGWVAFYGTSGEEIIVGPGTDQFDILRLARTHGPNGGPDTEEIIQRLRRFDEIVGIRIVRAESNRVDFDLKNQPKNVTAFAEEIFELCPDLVNKALGSIEMLKNQIEVVNYVWLWWDEK